jgi:anhydro-N-acetylmuramic acid kinase
LKTSIGPRRRKGDRAPALTVLGLMSGTSADAVSAALVRVGPDSIEPVAATDEPLPAALRERIHGLVEASAGEISRMNVRLGEAFASAARRLLRRAERRRIGVDLIASHGQTVLHAPTDRPPHTLQIGCPFTIAHRTGITTVADFRPRDMAAGGQGAPLVPFFDHFVFSGLAPIALVNLGGIANVTFVEREPAGCAALDIGPGNCMLDETVRAATGGRLAFDPAGKLARTGRLDIRLLERLERHPFFQRAAPKSASREDFVPAFLRAAAGSALRSRPADVLATLAFLTAETVAAPILRRRPRPAKAVVSGGGVRNAFLMERLADALYPIPAVSIETLGWPALAKEPAAFALLGYRALLGLPGTLPSCTGARASVVTGTVIPGDNYRPLLRRIFR